MKTDKSVSGNSAVDEFNRLPDSEKREVAERLLKIEESGWKPFWCADATCSGMPHSLLDENGEEIIVGPGETEGPNGESVSELVYETSDGDLFLYDENDPDTWPQPTDTPYGRLVYVPGWSHNHARVDQRLPEWQKRWILFIMSGRGAGKTRTGVEFVTLCARKGLDGGIVGRRGIELVNTHVAEIQAHAHPEFYPEHFASKDILVWPNGAITYLYSAERPENIRSVNLSYFWFDEAGWMDSIREAWDNAVFAARVKSKGNPIHMLITSTPTGTPWVMEMEDDPDVTVRRVSTYANKANLDRETLAAYKKKYEGTRKGRQELHGEVLRDVEGAMWDDSMIRHLRMEPNEFAEFLETLDYTVVAVDPAGSKNKRSDETGIVASGVMHSDEDGEPLAVSHYFVLGDASIKGTPSEWAKQTFMLARSVNANKIMAEKNYGGDMVKQVLTDYAKLHPAEAKNAAGEFFLITVEHAAESKETRAEGTVGKYEQGHVTHVVGEATYQDLSQMEKEQTTWVPPSRGGKMKSPNRVDALVWSIRNLETKIVYKAQTASQYTVNMVRHAGGGRSVSAVRAGSRRPTGLSAVPARYR